MHSAATTDGGQDIDQFQSVIETVTDGTFWRLIGAENTREAAAQAVAEGPPVVRFEHVATDAVLEAQYRHQSSTVCTLALFVMLDPTFERSDAYFTGSLAASHRSIAEKYATELVEPQTDTDVLLTAQIPSTVDQYALESTVAALTASALEAARLHDSICEPMSEYVNGACTPSPSLDR